MSNGMINVYDDLFDLDFRHRLYSFAQASYFKIGWADVDTTEKQIYQNLHSNYSEEDIERIGILERLQNTPAAKELVGYSLEKSVVNLSTAADINFYHSHPEDKVLLYYLNMDWLDGWYGETLFFDANCRDVVFTSPYTPNRLIAFDAKIPHAIRPQSHLAPQYRLTLSLLFKKC